MHIFKRTLKFLFLLFLALLLLAAAFLGLPFLAAGNTTGGADYSAWMRETLSGPCLLYTSCMNLSPATRSASAPCLQTEFPWRWISGTIPGGSNKQMMWK